jgi:hypothetical protein
MANCRSKKLSLIKTKKKRDDRGRYAEPIFAEEIIQDAELGLSFDLIHPVYDKFYQFAPNYDETFRNSHYGIHIINIRNSPFSFHLEEYSKKSVKTRKGNQLKVRRHYRDVGSQLAAYPYLLNMLSPENPYGSNDRFMDAVEEMDIPEENKTKIKEIMSAAMGRRSTTLNKILTLFRLLGFETINIIDDSCTALLDMDRLPMNDSDVLEENLQELKETPFIDRELVKEREGCLNRIKRIYNSLYKSGAVVKITHSEFAKMTKTLESGEDTDLDDSGVVIEPKTDEDEENLEELNQIIDDCKEINERIQDSAMSHYRRRGIELGLPITEEDLYATEPPERLKMKEILPPKMRSLLTIREERSNNFDRAKGRTRKHKKRVSNMSMKYM